MPSLRTLRGNLGSASFPFVSDFQGRTIIIPQFDQNFDRTVNSSAQDVDKDKGVPQVFYMHNVMPTSQGYQSIGYNTNIDAMNPAVEDFDQFFLLRDSDENKALFSPSAGNNYVYTVPAGGWASINPLPVGSFPYNGLVTASYIHKRTFIYYEMQGAIEYDFTAGTFSSVVFNGLVANNIRGICASTGYNIAFNEETVFWSSTTDETDFTPSLITGAGSQIPNDLKGKIVAILPVPQGFFIYSTKNIVSAFYSGNIRFPWIFREVPNSAGIANTNNVAWQSTLSLQYAWTTAGLMKIDRSGAEIVFPALADFIAGRVFEDFDEVTGLFSVQYSGSDFLTKLCFTGSRYLVLSYGLSQLTHAIVYDTSLKRWGKFKITHVDAFEWPAPNFFGIRTYDQLEGNTYDELFGNTYDQLSEQQFIVNSIKRDICFLQADGTVKVVNFDIGDADSNGVMFIGKYQFVRSSLIQLSGCDIECIGQQNANFVHKWYTTFDGKLFQQINIPTIINYQSGSLAKNYQGRAIGMNHTLFFGGGYNIVSFEIEFTVTGGTR